MQIGQVGSSIGGDAQAGRCTEDAEHFDFEVGGELPWDNLTRRVRNPEGCEASPFIADSVYADVFDGLYRALHRKWPRHLVLVRERGVGEQAVLVELARRAVKGRPAFLRGTQLLTVDCRHVPADEARSIVQGICGQWGNRENAIVALEGMGNLLRNRGIVDARSLFTSSLLRARCRIIGIMAPHELSELITADAELRELFSIIEVPEPQPPTAAAIVRLYANGLQTQYNVVVGDEAIQRAVQLSASCILHERLPHKAVKVLRSICDDIAYERSEQNNARREVAAEEVAAKVAQICGIPEHTLAGVGEGIDYGSNLAEAIVGQPHAVAEVAKELGLIKAGFADAGKPASVMMFIGQTGTGKTEMAKVLAKFYSASKRLKTFTLGNFSEPHSVSGLIGVPPGYVGHEQGGRLINELNADPYGVFLLDEADKAHPDVIQPFLNLFDEGWIADQRGVKAYADRAIFILTTNVGQRQIAEMCRNGKGIDEITATMKESLSRIRHTKSNRPVFTPEFLSRIKRIVVFRTLDQAAMLGICRRLVKEMQEGWVHRRRRSLLISPILIEAIARKASAIDEKSQGKEGGRIVRKLLADVVESAIQTAISAAPEEYRECRTVSVRLNDLAEDLSDKVVHVNFGADESDAVPTRGSL